jgi:hypothetical protein
LLWTGFSASQPEQQMSVVLASSTLRLFFVLGIAFVLLLAVEPYQGSSAFGIWVLVFYLFTLALETVLLLANQPTGQGS